MMLFRSARANDLAAIYYLANHCGIGLTTLPKDEAILQQRLNWSCQSFEKSLNHPLNEYYLFVLEDTLTSKVVGTSAIEANLGYELPFYSYKISKQIDTCHSLQIRSEYEVLNLVTDHHGKSEICTLFLNPSYRHSSNGLLLSRARFLFMAHYPNRFAPQVIAEMRGISDDKGYSPFWQHVGQHFFHMPFAEADRLTLSSNKQFITDLMPRHSLYVNLLDRNAQAVIGQPHQSTIPAMQILLKEGFLPNTYVDIFDAGPTLEASCQQIKTAINSQVLMLKKIDDKISSTPYLLANTKLAFRAIIGQVMTDQHTPTCSINREAARLLEVQIGDCLRVSPLRNNDNSLPTHTGSL